MTKLATLSKKKTTSNDLQNQAFFASQKHNPFSPPSAKSIREILESFRATGKYSKKFISSLEKGLWRSNYFNT